MAVVEPLTGKALQELYDHMCAYDAWPADHAALLAICLDPREVNTAYPEHCMAPQLLASFINLHRILLRAVKSCKLPELVPPADFLEWADRRGIELPSELRSAIHRRHANKHAVGEKPLPSHLNVIHILLVRYLNFDANQGKSSLAREISGFGTQIGQPIDESSVRKVIKQVKEKFSK